MAISRVNRRLEILRQYLAECGYELTPDELRARTRKLIESASVSAHPCQKLLTAHCIMECKRPCERVFDIMLGGVEPEGKD